MKDLKLTLGNDMYNGFTELNQLFQIYRYYLENMTGKQKDQSVEEFIESQMTMLESFCVSHIKKIKENLIKTTGDWKCKNTKMEEE